MTKTLKKPTQRSQDHVDIRRLLLAHFVQTGDGLTVKDLAAKLTWNESRVRRALTSDSGFSEGLDQHSEGRANKSRDYPMWDAPGGHLVQVYEPDKDALRAALQDTAELVEEIVAYADDNLPYAFNDTEGARLLSRTNADTGTGRFRRRPVVA